MQLNEFDQNNGNFNINDVKIRRGSGDFSKAWYAYWKGKRIGAAALCQYPQEELEKDERCIWKLFVKEEYRRRGVATKLYNAIEEYCKTQGWKLVPSPSRVLSDEAFQFWNKRNPELAKRDSRSWNSYYLGKELEYKGHTVRLRSFSDKGGLADYITPIKSVNSWGDEVTHSTVWVPADIVFSQLGKSEEYTINENVSYKEKNLSPREQTRYGINYPGARINTYSDGEIVGAIEIYFKNNNAYVSLVQVDTAFQRQGIGKELYRRAIALSCDHRCKNFYSDTGNCMSLPAHNLWNRLRDEYKVDFETDKGGYDSTGRKKISLSNIKEWKDYVPPVQNPAFLAWCNGSKVVDSSGNPLIVYHGTTHDFNKFDDSSSNPANHYGRALYFTSSKTDTENYAGIGPDLTSRIEHEADKLMSEWEWSDNEEYKGKSWNELYQLAKAEVSKKLKGPHEGFVMPCYLRMIKPVIVSKQGGTYFDVGYNYRTGAMTGRLARTVMKICPELWKEIFEECSDGISAYNFEKHVRRSNAMGNDDISDNGGPGPIIAKIYRAMGYDGIIMVNVSDTFEKMKMDKNSNHYIVWKANQVKSALGNKGTYNRRKPSITESSR